jgi:hypothetical protein
MATSIAVTGRNMAEVTYLTIHRLTPVYDNPLEFNIVYTISSPALGLRLYDINGGGANVNYSGTGLRAITLSTASLLSTITVISGYNAFGSVGAPVVIAIQEVSPTLDFIAVTSAFNSFVPRILRLPPVTAHKRPIFIKLARNPTGPNDGVFIITRGDSFIEFLTRDTEVVGGTTYNHSGAVFIGGLCSDGFAVNYPCITLFSDGSNWYVANYYPMNTDFGNNQFSLAGSSDNPSAPKLASGNASGVNIFKNNVAERQSGNNMVLLPTPTSPSICMIVYGGNQGTRSTGNALIIKDTRVGSWIDGFSSNNPCILINGDSAGGNAKSTGIVLFYDTTGAGKWYVIGWYYPLNWTWGNSSTTATYGDIQGYHAMKDMATPAGEERKICVISDIGGARFYTLPTTTANNPQVIILKASNIGTYPAWNTAISYPHNAIVAFGGQNWRSQISNNTRNAPGTLLANWVANDFYPVGSVRYYLPTNKAYITIVSVFADPTPPPNNTTNFAEFQTGSSGSNVWDPVGAPDSRGLRYSTQLSVTTNNNKINTGTISIKYGSSDSSNNTSKYSCIWFVSEQVTGEAFLRYYPVVGYVPFP